MSSLSPLQSLPLQSRDLNRFIQQWLVSLIGIDPTLMRPAWQAEPSNIPKEATAWAAFRITPGTDADTFPAFVHLSDGEGRDQLQRHERLDLLVSLYDLGVDGEADFLATMLRDGAQVAQNRETLTNVGMNLISAGRTITVPVLMKQRWLYRVDVPFVLGRAVTRTYEVLNVESAEVVLRRDNGYKQTIEINKEP